LHAMAGFGSETHSYNAIGCRKAHCGNHLRETPGKELQHQLNSRGLYHDHARNAIAHH
jgi:hypothetical protein